MVVAPTLMHIWNVRSLLWLIIASGTLDRFQPRFVEIQIITFHIPLLYATYIKKTNVPLRNILTNRHRQELICDPEPDLCVNSCAYKSGGTNRTMSKSRHYSAVFSWNRTGRYMNDFTNRYFCFFNSSPPINSARKKRKIESHFCVAHQIEIIGLCQIDFK